jgi:hypothetical protein
MFYIVEKIWWVLGMAIGRVVHGYIVRESIPARQNSTHTRTHKRSWVWICIHTRTRRVSAIQWIPVTRPHYNFSIKHQTTILLYFKNNYHSNSIK